jgi:transcriptional regulator with PAS, ATPase and Fis domain
VVSIFIPPLRERKGDILPLVEHFVQKYNQKTGKKIQGITTDAKDILLSYPWPGNIRELENVIERAIVLGRGEAIDKSDLAYLSFQKTEQFPSDFSLRELEKSQILKVLEKTEGNLTQAAELLGIHRNTLRLKIKEYEIK